MTPRKIRQCRACHLLVTSGVASSRLARVPIATVSWVEKNCGGVVVLLAWWWLSPQGGHGMLGLSMEMRTAMDMAVMGDVRGKQLRGVEVQPGDNLICSEDRDISSQALLKLLVRAAVLLRNLLAEL